MSSVISGSSMSILDTGIRLAGADAITGCDTGGTVCCIKAGIGLTEVCL
jgi:hypothetical protein